MLAAQFGEKAFAAVLMVRTTVPNSECPGGIGLLYIASGRKNVAKPDKGRA